MTKSLSFLLHKFNFWIYSEFKNILEYKCCTFPGIFPVGCGYRGVTLNDKNSLFSDKIYFQIEFKYINNTEILHKTLSRDFHIKYLIFKQHFYLQNIVVNLMNYHDQHILYTNMNSTEMYSFIYVVAWPRIVLARIAFCLNG